LLKNKKAMQINLQQEKDINKKLSDDLSKAIEEKAKAQLVANGTKDLPQEALLTAQIEAYKNKIKVLEDTVLRTHAELQNYRKRKDEETAKIIKYAEEDILKGFLPILDNFERAINMDDNNFGDETSKFLEGFRMVYNQTKALLEKFEVKEIDCLGKEFDPTYEQAVSTTKRPDKKSGTVVEIYQKGYMYKDRVLRTAMVIVNE